MKYALFALAFVLGAAIDGYAVLVFWNGVIVDNFSAPTITYRQAVVGYLAYAVFRATAEESSGEAAEERLGRAAVSSIARLGAALILAALV